MKFLLAICSGLACVALAWLLWFVWDTVSMNLLYHFRYLK